MWKKADTKTTPPAQNSQNKVVLPPKRQPVPSTNTVNTDYSGSTARIGPKTFVKGDVYGEEDLVVEGKVEGKVTLEKHSVVVASSGKVDADVFADNIRVAGEVHGNLRAAGQVVLLETARLEGDITAKTITAGERMKLQARAETVIEKGADGWIESVRIMGGVLGKRAGGEHSIRGG